MKSTITRYFFALLYRYVFRYCSHFVTARLRLSRILSVLVVFAVLSAFQNHAPAATYPVEWLVQYGTSATDVGTAITADSLGNVWVAGYRSSAGPSIDMVTTKFTTAGAPQWSQLMSSTGLDQGNAIAHDGTGNAFTVGRSEGSLFGANVGLNDIVIRKHDPVSGADLGSSQSGTTADDFALGAGHNSVGLLVSGYTTGNLATPSIGGQDAFVRQYNSAGGVAWTSQFGTTGHDQAYGVAALPGGQAVAAGGLTVAPGNEDVFVQSFNSSGATNWAQALSTSNVEKALGVTTDFSGNIYITGYADGTLDPSGDAFSDLSAGGFDSFVAKYDSSGMLQWFRLLGSNAYDQGSGVAVDSLGNVFITGHTFGSLAGPSNGNMDFFVSMFDSSGNLNWTEQFGTGQIDRALGIAVDGSDNVYVTGFTSGGLNGNTNLGLQDAFVMKLTAVPEPATGIAAVLGGLLILYHQFRKRKANR